MARRAVLANDARGCREAPVELFEWAATVEIDEVTELASTPDDWTDQIAADVQHRAADAHTEAANSR